MSCQVNFPLQDIVLLLRDKISPETIGAVPEEQLEGEVLSFIQPKIDELQAQLTKLPPEVYVVAQALQGSVLETTLNNGKVLTSDLSPLFTEVYNALRLKADKATTLTGYGITDAYTKSEIDTNYGGVKTLYDKNVAAGAGANGWTDLLIATSENVNQRQINDGLDSIATMLAIQNPRNGQRVYVKSYHAGLNKGGGEFIYVASKASENDGFMCFNGWVRQIKDGKYNAYMSGCKCDGETDDTQNFDKIMYWLEKNNVGGTVTIEGNLYINSEIEYKGKQKFVYQGGYNTGETIKVGIRLSCSNVTLNIPRGSKISFGSHFHDSNTYMINVADQKFSGDYIYQGQLNNIEISGGGTIDMTRAGCMASEHKYRRYCILIGMVDTFKCSDITFIGGDMANIIVSNTVLGVDFVGVARKHYISNCHFIDTFYDENNISGYKSVSSDHSTIYVVAPETYITGCTFTQSSVWGRSMACATELHGNNQHFYSNTIKGYCRAVIVAAYSSDQEAPRPELQAGTYVRTGHKIYNNIAYCYYFISVWGKGVPYGTIECYNNTHNAVKCLTDAEILQAGGNANKVLYPAFFAISGESGLVITPTVPVKGRFLIQDNTYNATFDPAFATEQFALLSNPYLRDNMHFINNNIDSPYLVVVDTTYLMSLSHFIWKGNTIKEPTRLTPTGSPFLLSVQTLTNAEIDIDFGHMGPRDITQNLVLIDVHKPNECVNNSVIVRQSRRSWDTHLTWLAGNYLLKDYTFYEWQGNTAQYPMHSTLSVSKLNDTTLSIFSSSVLCKGTRRMEALRYVPARNFTFYPPPTLMRDITSDVYVSCMATAGAIGGDYGDNVNMFGFFNVTV